MPARREYTAEELRERAERRREQTRQAVARHRERKHGDVSLTVSLTPPPSTRARDVRSPGSPVSEPSTTTTPFEEIDRRLGRFAGYVADPALWARLAQKYPDVDLVLAAIGMAEWLDRPANRKRRCSPGFVANWVKRAHGDVVAAVNAPAPVRPARTSRYAEILAMYGYADAPN